METNNQVETAAWVDGRLALLECGGEWQPNVGRANALLRARYEQRRSGHWAWAAVTAACICLTAFPAPRAVAQRCLNCSIAMLQKLSTATGVEMRMYPPNTRKPAPDFALTDAAGKLIRISDLRGKVVVLNIWATWCGGCKVEIPWLMEFQQRYGRRDLAVLGISFDDDGWTVVRPFLQKKNINYPVMIGNSKIAALYGGVDALPKTLLIDRSGRIALIHVGLVSKDSYTLELETLLSERSAANRSRTPQPQT